ncbi:hypothetical protein [Acidisphaera sp. L21]|uniref:hypothetical protein n=1 Tax=Acidisphaera sp. L21 TaxID=1641851 RepID=UPI00131BC747|nr:hypothetical protein [Acidisphaera sp. L21]
MTRAAALLVVLLLGGCSSAGNIVGVIVGAAAGGATANPAIGFGVGVGVAAVSDYALRKVSRSWHQGEQDAIAATAGGLDIGATGAWKVEHSLPLGEEHGHLQIVRAIENPLAPCKQVLFSVEESKEPPAWYSVDICQQQSGWKWASAEPAVERWGFLQ